jgi:Ca-activated chloride channel family protein
VRVYTILVGRGGEVPMPVRGRDPATGQTFTRTVRIEVQIDEELLRKIAKETGGEFFRATDSASLRNIFDRIDRLEKSEIKLTAYRRYRELFPPFLAAAAGLLAASALLWGAGLRVVPA